MQGSIIGYKRAQDCTYRMEFRKNYIKVLFTSIKFLTLYIFNIEILILIF